MLGRSKTLSNIFQKGIVNDITEGLGVGGIINFADDRTGGHLKSKGISLGRTINGQPLSLNLTDLVMALATTGIHLKGSSLMTFATVLISKKAGEAFGIIMDDPLPNDGRQKMTFPQIKVEKMSTAAQRNGMVQQMAYGPGTFGGVNC